jgi:hypothetical protein
MSRDILDTIPVAPEIALPYLNCISFNSLMFCAEKDRKPCILDVEDVLIKAGVKPSAIARQFGISHSDVRKALAQGLRREA